MQYKIQEDCLLGCHNTFFHKNHYKKYVDQVEVLLLDGYS